MPRPPRTRKQDHKACTRVGRKAEPWKPEPEEEQNLAELLAVLEEANPEVMEYVAAEVVRRLSAEDARPLQLSKLIQHETPCKEACTLAGHYDPSLTPGFVQLLGVEALHWHHQDIASCGCGSGDLATTPHSPQQIGEGWNLVQQPTAPSAVAGAFIISGLPWGTDYQGLTSILQQGGLCMHCDVHNLERWDDTTVRVRLKRVSAAEKCMKLNGFNMISVQPDNTGLEELHRTRVAQPRDPPPKINDGQQEELLRSLLRSE